MIRTVLIENFKSIVQLEVPLGRVNVFIGENGCGKTNILEAICFGGAAAANKLDNEFLRSRGIRMASPVLMRSGFRKDSAEKPIRLKFVDREERRYEPLLLNTNKAYSKWIELNREDLMVEVMEEMVARMARDGRPLDLKLGSIRPLLEALRPRELLDQLAPFLIYSPQAEKLRALEQESLIEPLGIYGEGVFKLLKTLDAQGLLGELKESLESIDWFADIEALDSAAPGERSLRIRDHYLTSGVEFFDQQTANEGFLFLLFYTCLVISPDTPRFFAIDNLEAALNPKLCMHLMRNLARLAEKHDKQLIVTTHNPAILDGLDIKDEEQRLFVVYRNIDGETRLRRIERGAADSAQSLRLSEAFLRGYIGGLPANF